jgi:TrmH family RNA methyltransferase
VKDGSLIPRFGRARRDPALAVLEGFHPLKHALRFGARLLDVVTSDGEELERLAAELAPDLHARIRSLAHTVDREVFNQLSPFAPSTGVISLAERPASNLHTLLCDRRAAPIVLLEDPRDLGNMGACVRVAAAADIAGVLSTGSHDPWHPDALRGAAGLHFALPVARLAGPRGEDGPLALDALGEGGRELIALDPEGEELDPARLPARAILAFGTERQGLSEELCGRAHARLSIPMRAGVSSLNLATSVAAVLFARRLSHTPRPPAA